MRLWHKDLIAVLPNQQLLGQWRECCGIAHDIAIKGSPNHMLVNKVMGYPLQHFTSFAAMVADEMEARGYNVDRRRFEVNARAFITGDFVLVVTVKKQDLFSSWHTNRYLNQCYYNLEEKYDCGGIPQHEWQCVLDFMSRELTGVDIKNG